jgi:L,D-transpeptidase-like protein
MGLNTRRAVAVVRLASAVALSFATALSLGAAPRRVYAAPTPAVATNESAKTAAVLPAAADWPSESLGSINPTVFKLAVQAASCAISSGSVAPPSTLTVIDYSLPSTSSRLWIYDLRSHALLNEELVAHGQGSGENIPTKFSNDDESHESSIGLFVTRDTYIGKHGYSLRLQGLDAGFNDHALARDIVVHGASYVSDEFVRSQGRLGRSWGCPAVREGIVREVIDRIKGGNLIFAYYPDPAWLATSKYLGTCASARP